MAVSSPEYACWLVSSLRSGLAAVDEHGVVVALNAEAQRVLGCPEGAVEAAYGRPCREVFASQPTVAGLLLDALDGRERPTRTELEVRAAPDGPVRTVGFTLLPVRDPAGEVRGAAMLFRDLTPYEQSHEQDRLRDRLAALGEMAAGLAHEIRNPLAGMEVLAGLLRRRLADRPAERELVSDLCAETRRLAETVSASLEFVRPVVLRRDPTDPVKLLEEALSRARAHAGSDVAIERDFPASAPDLLADAEGLRGVLTNLILNALEAMAASPRDGGHRLRLGLRVESADRPARALRVTADAVPVASEHAPRPELVFSVGDTGPGVPEELHDRIFYPFFTTKQRGCGIGLANAQKVVAGHGGRLELASRPGAGAEFRVRLPLDNGGGA